MVIILAIDNIIGKQIISGIDIFFHYAVFIVIRTQKPPYRQSFLHYLLPIGVEYQREVLESIL